MIAPETKQTIQALSEGVAPEIVEEFLTSMDDDYFELFSADAISGHLRMSGGLNASRPVAVGIAAGENDEFEITIAGFDHHAQFSIFCGLISAFALNIRSGDIFTSSQKGTRAAKRRILDVFKVTPESTNTFDGGKQHEFRLELETLGRLLAAGSVEEARERLNRFLVDRMEDMGERLSVLAATTTELQFNNQASPRWTVIDACSQDAFGLLFAISNALSMKGADIRKVRIRGSSGQARDQFFVLDRWGRKIESPDEQQRLLTSVRMIQRLTGVLPEAPDPAKAMRHFDQLLDAIVETPEETFRDRMIAFLASQEGMRVMAQLLGSSDFLWDDLLRTHFAEFLPIVEELARTKPQLRTKESVRQDLRQQMEKSGAKGVEEKQQVLNRFKDRQLFLIDCHHVLQPHGTLEEFSRAVTDLAEVVIEEAGRVSLEHAGMASASFAIFGLGKFGGREMGYASDIELQFVHEGGTSDAFEAVARQTAGLVETRSKGIFHIDLRLRPHGDAGPWSIPFEQFAKYYSMEGDAAAFERQALIKLRWIAGDEQLGRKVEAHRDRFTYSGAPWDLEGAIHLRRRQRRELAAPGAIHVKYGAGGIVDIEYAAQYLQLLNGKDHPEIRVPDTLGALEALRRLQIVRENDYETLQTAYHFLRNLIDALRIVRGDASDLVLPEEDSEEFKSLARRLNYGERDRKKAAALLSADVRDWMKKVYEYYRMRFERDAEAII